MDLHDWAALDEQAVETQRALKMLVKSFDSGDGLPRKVYEATYDLLIAQMGYRAASQFAKTIDATDGRFYFKNSAGCQDTVRKIFGE